MSRVVLLAVLALAGNIHASTATWTNTLTGASDYWTNNANWNAASYPGTLGGESAYLTNSTSTTYTNILDYSLGAALNTLSIYNTGGGEAWLVVTNAVLTNSTLTVRTGGRLRIDAGGFATNNFVTMDQVGGQIYVNAGGRLDVRSDWSLGSGAASSNNLLLVNGGAFNTYGNSMTVGASGSSFNQFIVTNAGQAFVMWDLVTGGSGNLIHVTGPNSWLTLSNYRLFLRGNSNRLVVADGGKLAMTNAGGNNNVSVGDNTGDAWNSVLVTGSGSVASNRAINVGVADNARFNSYTVANSGTVYSVGFVLGRSFTSAGAVSNSIVVTDPGSAFYANGTSFIGGSSAALLGTNSSWNSLTVSNGAFFYCSGLTVGAWVNANSNAFNVGGLGLSSLVTNGSLTIGSSGASYNTLTVTNATFVSGATTIGSGTSNNTATVTAGSVWKSQGNGITIGSGAATGNVLYVDGGTLTNVGAITLGGSYNRLVFTNGARHSGVGGVAGAIYTGGLALGSRVEITGSNTFYATDQIKLGSQNGGTSNSILISGGAVVWIYNNGTGSSGFILGGAQFGPFYNNHWNTATITGSGSVLSNTYGGLIVGGASTGKFNSAWVSAGAIVLSDINIGSGAYAQSNTVTVTDPGSRWDTSTLGGAGPYAVFGSGVGAAYNGLTISNGAVFIHQFGSGGVQWDIGNGAGANSNYWNIGGLGAASLATNIGSLRIGVAGGAYNYINITNALLYISGSAVNVGSGGSNNSIFVNTSGILDAGGSGVGAIGTGGAVSNTILVNGGLVTNVGASAATIGNGSSLTTFGNSIVISNGGRWLGGNIIVGSGGSISNLYQVGGLGPISAVSNGTITVGNTSSGLNQMLVTNATLLSGAVAVGNGSSNNTVTVTGGVVWNALGNTITAGSGAATSNVLWIQAGGLLEAGGLVASAGNLITNSGGIYQFTTATPTINGAVVLVDGTISFRNLSTGLNLTNNWRGSQLTNLTFAGNNTLRLNNATATNTLAGGYTFNIGLGATNYTRLEVINGTTGVRGAGVTIGAGGSFLASNTVATFSGAFTNNGIADLANATVIFSNGLHVAGTLRGNGTIIGTTTVAGVIAPGFSPGTITFSNNFTLTGTAQMELFSGGNLGSSDKINVLAALSGGGVVQVTTNGTFVIAAGDKWDLFDWTSGTPTFTFDGSAVVLDSGLSWDTSQLNLDGTIAVIPEPSAWVLVILGLLGVRLVRRTR